MLRPTPRLVLVVAGGIPFLLLATLVEGRLGIAAAVLVGFVWLLAAADALAGPRVRQLEVDVETPEHLFVGDKDPALVRLTTRGVLRVTDVELLLDLGEILEPVETLRIALPPGREVTAAFDLVPRRRGAAEVRALWIRWSGPLGLFRRVVRMPLDRTVGVIPNVRAVRRAAIRFFRSREFVQGLKTERYLGDGSEFDSLREHLPGMDSRTIDWKASARHTRMVSREYRAERDHQIVLAFDTGHLLREPLAGIPKLDHAINAGLLLAYTALKTGDRIGLFAFDSQVRLFAEPRGGMGSFPRVRARTTELAYSHEETNFTLAFTSLLSRLRRRTLVVTFTDFVDTVTVELMVENLARAAAKHLVLCVTLRDPELRRLSRARPGDLADLHRSVVAEDLERERVMVLSRLRKLGVHCLEAPSANMSVSLVNRYLDIKRRELV